MQHYLRENQMNREKRIRQLEPSDRSIIKELVVSSGKFNDVEIKTALELVDNALKEGEASGYIFAMLECGKMSPSLLRPPPPLRNPSRIQGSISLP